MLKHNIIIFVPNFKNTVCTPKIQFWSQFINFIINYYYDIVLTSAFLTRFSTRYVEAS